MRAIVWSIKSIAVGHISVNKEANPNYKHGYVVTCRINNEVHACKIYLHAVMDISVFSSVFVLSYWFQLTKRKCDRWAIQMHIRIPMCSRVQPRCSFFCVRSRPHWLFASSRIIQFGQWSSNCCVEHVTSERWLFSIIAKSFATKNCGGFYMDKKKAKCLAKYIGVFLLIPCAGNWFTDRNEWPKRIQ